MLHDGEEDATDVLIFAPVLSGADIANGKLKKTDQHTEYFVCDVEDFESIFTTSNPEG